MNHNWKREDGSSRQGKGLTPEIGRRFHPGSGVGEDKVLHLLVEGPQLWCTLAPVLLQGPGVRKVLHDLNSMEDVEGVRLSDSSRGHFQPPDGVASQ